MRTLSRLVTAILIATPAIAGAQASVPAAAAPAAKAEKRDQGIPHHFDGITLTDEQKTKIRQLNHDYHTLMNAIRVPAKKKDEVTGLTKPPTEQTKKKLADLESKEHAEFRALLTPEQQVIFDKNAAREKADEAAKAVKPGD